MTYLALKDVEKTEPMPNLVSCGPTQMIVCHIATGEGSRKNVAPVLVKGRTPLERRSREVANAEQATSEIGEEINVEVGVVAFAQSGLHFAVVVAGGPAVIDSEVGADELEVDAVWAVGLVENIKLGWVLSRVVYLYETTNGLRGRARIVQT